MDEPVLKLLKTILRWFGFDPSSAPGQAPVGAFKLRPGGADHLKEILVRFGDDLDLACQTGNFTALCENLGLLAVELRRRVQPPDEPVIQLNIIEMLLPDLGMVKACADPEYQQHKVEIIEAIRLHRTATVVTLLRKMLRVDDGRSSLGGES